MGRPGPVVTEPEPEPEPKGSLRVVLEAERGGCPVKLSLFPRDLSHQRLLEGVGEEEALDRLRSLFHLCGRAQEKMAVRALAAARRRGTGEPAPVDEDVLRESLFESLRALLLPVTGEAILPSSDQAVWRSLRDLGKGSEAQEPDFFRKFRTLLEDVVLGEGVPLFLTRETARDFDSWLKTRRTNSPVARRAALLGPEGEVDVSMLPGLSLGNTESVVRLARALDNRDFLSGPHLEGKGRETGSLDRQRHHPLVSGLWRAARPLSARLAARLVELALWAGGENGSAAEGDRLAGIRSLSLGDGEGMSWGQTSRGLLVHRWSVRDGRVAEVRILAPTEWTFAPKGSPFASWCSSLSRRGGSGSLRRKIVGESLWVFDPCAPVVIREACPGVAGDGRDA